VVYVEEAVEVRKVTFELNKATANLKKLQELLDEEFKRLEIKTKNHPL